MPLLATLVAGALAVAAAAAPETFDRPDFDLTVERGGSVYTGNRFRLSCWEGGTRCDGGWDVAAQVGVRLTPTIDFVAGYRRVSLEGAYHLDAPAVGFALWAAPEGPVTVRFPVLLGPLFAYGTAGVAVEAAGEVLVFPARWVGVGAGLGIGTGLFDGSFAMLLRATLALHLRL